MRTEDATIYRLTESRDHFTKVREDEKYELEQAVDHVLQTRSNLNGTHLYRAIARAALNAHDKTSYHFMVMVGELGLKKLRAWDKRISINNGNWIIGATYFGYYLVGRYLLKFTQIDT